MSFKDFLGRAFDPAARQVARELERTDPMAPAAPMVPESTVGIHQIQPAGSHSWQLQQLREADERLEGKAARMGAKARQNASRAIAEGRTGTGGQPAFAMTAAAQDAGTDEAGRPLLGNPVFDTEYGPAQALKDEEQLQLPGGLPPETRGYRRREEGAPRHRPSSFSSPEDKARRIAMIDRPEPVIVRLDLHAALGMTPEQVDARLRAHLDMRLAELELDPAQGEIQRVENHWDFEYLLVWKPKT